jgi:hypothetical protein
MNFLNAVAGFGVGVAAGGAGAAGAVQLAVNGRMSPDFIDR